MECVCPDCEEPVAVRVTRIPGLDRGSFLTWEEDGPVHECPMWTAYVDRLLNDYEADQWLPEDCP